MPLRIIQLVCHACHGHLVGLGDDSVFFCPPCALGHEVGPERLTAHPCEHVVVDGAGDAELWLPFWGFTVEVSLQGDATSQLQEGLPSRVWVEGFRPLGHSYFGQPGLDLTGAAPQVHTESRPGGPMPVGCRRTLEQAARYVPLYLQTMLGRTRDLTGLTLQLELGAAHLVAWPVRVGEDIAVLGAPRQYPRVMFEDLSAMRAHQPPARG